MALFHEPPFAVFASLFSLSYSLYLMKVFDLRDEIKLDKQTPIVKFALTTPKITGKSTF